MQTIFDIGANNGDDIPYYLSKAEKVVAVEPNPGLASLIESRFKEDISKKHLVVERCAIGWQAEAPSIVFYSHIHNPVLSTIVKPADMAAFEEIVVPLKSMSALVAAHGTPDFVKIDTEGADADILRSMLESDIVPELISVEAHSPVVLGLLVGCGKYRSFNIIDGRSVGDTLAMLRVTTKEGERLHSFPPHSAGPFGEDIPQPWISSEELVRKLASIGFGWLDIHASTTIEPEPNAFSKGDLLRDLVWKASRKVVRQIIRRAA